MLDKLPWRLIAERSFLFIPALLARLESLLRKRRGSRLLQCGETLLIFPRDRSLAYLARIILDWWLEVYRVPVHAVYLPEASKQHPALKSQVVWAKNPFLIWIFLLRGRYRTVVFLEPQRYRLLSFLAWLALIPNRCGFTLQDENPFLNFRFAFNESSTHYIHQLRAFFEELSGQKRDLLPLLEKKPPEPVLPKALNIIMELGLGKFVAICPAENPWPSWPKEYYGELISFISFPVLLLSLDEHGYRKNEQILKTAKEIFSVKTEIYLMPVEEELLLATLSSRAEVLLTEDNLFAHYAAHYGARVITLFGPRNEKVLAPFSNKAQSLTAMVPCRPCWQIASEFRCHYSRAYACVYDISVESVVEKLKTILAKDKK